MAPKGYALNTDERAERLAAHREEDVRCRRAVGAVQQPRWLPRSEASTEMRSSSRTTIRRAARDGVWAHRRAAGTGGRHARHRRHDAWWRLLLARVPVAAHLRGRGACVWKRRLTRLPVRGGGGSPVPLWGSGSLVSW